MRASSLPALLAHSLAFAAVLAVLGISSVAPAATRTWTNSSPGDLLEPSNWSDGIVPNSSSDIAAIGSNPTAAGNFALNGPMTLSALNYTNSQARSVFGTGTLTLAADSGIPTIQVSQQSLNFAADIAGTAGLNKTGAGTLVLSGDKSYSGINRVSAGKLSGNTIANGGIASAFGTGGFELISSATFEYTGTDATTDRAFELANSGSIHVSGSASTLALTRATGAGAVSGTGTFYKDGDGTLQIVGHLGHTGETHIREGVLSLGASERMPDSSAVRLYSPPVGSVAELALNGFSETIHSLQGSTGSRISLGSGNLTIGGNSPGTVFGGTITGTGSLTNSGTGRIELSGVSSYQGGTRILGGRIQATSMADYGIDSSLGRGNIEIANGATLRYHGPTSSTNRSITLGSDGGVLEAPLADSTLTLGGEISGPGSIRISTVSAGTIVLSSANSYAGGTTIRGRTLINNSIGSATGTGAVTLEYAEFGGAGAIAGPLSTLGGYFTPGNGIGVLSVDNNLSFGTDSTWDYEVHSGSKSADLVNVNGDLAINPTAKLDLRNLHAGSFDTGTKLTLISYSGNWSGRFAGTEDDKVSFINGQAFRINYDDDTPGANGGAHDKHVTLTAIGAVSQLTVSGLPGYASPTGTGLQSSSAPFFTETGVNNHGTAVGYATKYAAGTYLGYRAVRWNSTSSNGELGTLGTSSSGVSNAFAYAINEAGIAVGYSEIFVGNLRGWHAVRWDASGTAAIELGNLAGPNYFGTFESQAYAVNEAGVAVGFSEKGTGRTTSLGHRAVRWNAGSTVAIELDVLGAHSSGHTLSYANAINDAGVIVGRAQKYVADVLLGFRAVRWVPTGTAVTELDQLAGLTNAEAVAINSAGTAVGYADNTKFPTVNPSGSLLDRRAVRWAATGTSASELGSLGVNSNGRGDSRAYAINSAGDAVGYSTRYESFGNITLGKRAVRWNAASPAVIELGNLGTSRLGFTEATAYDLNDAGTAIGQSRKYVGGQLIGDRAIIWLPDTSAIDLNDLNLVDSSEDGTWLLINATSISSDGWVTGVGTFTPAASSTAYYRDYIIQVGFGGTWTDDFSGSLNGTWGRGPQWSTGTPAMQLGDATFSANSAYAVTLDRDELTRSIEIEAGDVSFDLAGHTLSTLLGTTVASGASLSAAGTIIGDVTSAGTIAPGSSPGLLTIDGALISTGAIEFEIDGRGAGQFDELQVGDFLAAGTLKVLLGSFNPSAGDVFDLMDFDTFTDNGYAFDFTAAQLAPNLHWDTSRFESNGTIRVTAAVPEPSVLIIATGLAISFAAIRRRNKPAPRRASFFLPAKNYC